MITAKLTALIAQWRELDRLDRKHNNGWTDGKYAKCADELAAVVQAEASAPPGIQVWQPIETAPKDGTWAMLYVRWQDQRDIIGCGQWTMDGEMNYVWFWPWSNPPTHWMPLPDPPSVSAVPTGEQD